MLHASQNTRKTSLITQKELKETRLQELLPRLEDSTAMEKAPRRIKTKLDSKPSWSSPKVLSMRANSFFQMFLFVWFTQLIYQPFNEILAVNSLR
jgi:hypothetical protein